MINPYVSQIFTELNSKDKKVHIVLYEPTDGYDRSVNTERFTEASERSQYIEKLRQQR